MKKLLIAALLAAPVAVPAHAQSQDRVLTIFGRDKCPENTICVRAPESERFRIPKNLRNDVIIAPERQAWAARASSVLEASKTGPLNTCSAEGPFGSTDCFGKQARAAKADRRQEAQTSDVDLDAKGSVSPP